MFAGDGNLASPDELLSEAFIRLENGQRRWKRGQSFLKCVAGAIRSLATDRMFLTDARQVRGLTGGYSVVADEELPNVPDAGNDNSVARQVMADHIFKQLEQHFAGDDEMQMLLMGIQDDLLGQELLEALEVDAKRLEALRTRLNRQITKIGHAYRAMEGQSR